MIKNIFKRKDPQTEIAESLIQKDFLRTVQHYVAFPNGESPFSFAILPLNEGILTSISREHFTSATDETGRLILTALNNSAQIIVDYEFGFMTVTMGHILYETFPVGEAPKKEHDSYYR